MARPTVVVYITRRTLILSLGVLLVAVIVMVAIGRQPELLWVAGPLRERVSGRLVVIDPGHGGYDPGAVAANGTLEKDVVLSIARRLERLLNQAAIYTLLTRTEDKSVQPPTPDKSTSRKRQDLMARVEIANEAQADLFISIHCNSFPQSIWSGAQTFYFPNQNESKRLAVAIQSELVRRLGPNRRQANAGDYRVLKDTKMPAVVVEVGFLSNPREARLLADPAYQERVGTAIYYGILRYYQSTDVLRR